MGKIKSKLMKRTARTLIADGIEFSDEFERNKKVLGREMPSKKLRNRIAGYISRLKRQEKEKEAKLARKKA